MFCRYCGKEVEEQGSFCEFCGKGSSPNAEEIGRADAKKTGDKKKQNNLSIWLTFIITLLFLLFLTYTRGYILGIFR
ncbi:MAG: hypothetical protein ACM3UU_01395 [Ignavibacteriales bacterium]